jgi:hypothetical protein
VENPIDDADDADTGGQDPGEEEDTDEDLEGLNEAQPTSHPSTEYTTVTMPLDLPSEDVFVKVRQILKERFDTGMKKLAEAPIEDNMEEVNIPAKVLIWSPKDQTWGWGNRMYGIISAVIYALLTDRIFLCTYRLQ